MKNSRLKFKIFGRIAYFILTPVLKVYLSKRISTRILIINKNRQVLVVRNLLSNGNLGLPGGGLKKNESPSQALIREVEEEVNLKLLSSDISYKGIFLAKNDFIKYHYHLWFGFIDQEQAGSIKIKSFEILDLDWIEVNKLKDFKLSSELKYSLEVWQRETDLIK